MHIVVRHPRYLPIDDDRNLGDIESSTPNVRRNEERNRLLAEHGETLESFWLGEVRVECGTGDRSGELSEEGSHEGRRAAVRDEEDRLGEFGLGILLCGSLRALVRVSRTLLRFGSDARVERRGVREGTEVEEEVDEVDFANLGGDEDVVLGKTGGRGDTAFGFV